MSQTCHIRIHAPQQCSLVRSPEVESFRGPLVSRLGAICRFEIGFQVCSSPSRALASFKSSVSKPSVNQP
jgi:hypothetical protein